MGNLFYRAHCVWDHRWTPGRMAAYVDGELGSRRRVRLERHVEESGEFRRCWRAFARWLEALHPLPAPSGSASRAGSPRPCGSGYASRPLGTEAFFIYVGSNGA